MHTVSQGYTIPLLDQYILIGRARPLSVQPVHLLRLNVPANHSMMLTILCVYTIFRYLYLIQVEHAAVSQRRSCSAIVRSSWLDLVGTYGPGRFLSL
jgi:hypothetical protein